VAMARLYSHGHESMNIGVGTGEGGGGTCPPKIREKIFFGQLLPLYVKFGHFSGKNHVKFENFVNFSGKYKKIWVF